MPVSKFEQDKSFISKNMAINKMNNYEKKVLTVFYGQQFR